MESMSIQEELNVLYSPDYEIMVYHSAVMISHLHWLHITMPIKDIQWKNKIISQPLKSTSSTPTMSERETWWDISKQRAPLKGSTLLNRASWPCLCLLVTYHNFWQLWHPPVKRQTAAWLARRLETSSGPGGVIGQASGSRPLAGLV